MRKHVSPAEFEHLKREYYKQKAPYDQQISQLLQRRIEGESKQREAAPIIMPVHPAEEHATGNLTDQVAKESADSTASDHALHDVDNKASSGGAHSKATAQDHKASPGPVMAENIGQPASRDELKKRAEELNK